MKVVKFNSKLYKEVNEIYKTSFPEEERYISLNKMIKQKDTILYCLIDEKKTVLGIIYLMVYNNTIFVLYLAVNQNIRSKGYGAYLLNWCLEKYADKTIYLNIDEVDEKAEDYEIRLRRKNFYLRNGFYMTNLMSLEDVQNFNVLANKEKVNINEYIKLDKFVAKVLGEPESNIVEV